MIKKYYFEIIVFITGAVVMVIELVGSRLLAPYLGTSIYVWTSLIGIMLASLSIGYYWGGRISKDKPTLRTLADIILYAALFAATILILEIFLPLFAELPIDIRISTAVVSSLLFSPVTIALGMVSPYVARLKINSLHDVGTSLGTLYAVSTIGSIIGTFLGGFILISYVGTRVLFITVALILFCLYLFITGTSKLKIVTKKVLLFLLVVLCMFIIYSSYLTSNGNIIADIDSHYNRWIVYEQKDARGEHVYHYLTNGIGGIQSGVDLADPTTLLFPYLQAFDTAFLLKPQFTSTLLIGAGAYTYPLHFAARYPDRHMDVIEIDPEVLNIAEKYFSYTPQKNVTAISEDGRTFLNSTKNIYDIVFLDAFSSRNSIPYQLTTLETARAIKKSLTPDGLVIMNVLASVTGDKAQFLQAEYKTYKQLFPQVVAFQVDSGQPKERLQNILLIASADIKPVLTNATSSIPETLLKSNIPVLTDDFAPIEYYTRRFADHP
jgi:predicted membrane-bound spermidine synthase